MCQMIDENDTLDFIRTKIKLGIKFFEVYKYLRAYPYGEAVVSPMYRDYFWKVGENDAGTNKVSPYSLIRDEGAFASCN